MGSESQAPGALLESVDALDSDPGPNLMNLMHRNGPRTLDSSSPPGPLPGPLNRVHVMNLMKRMASHESNAYHDSNACTASNDSNASNDHNGKLMNRVSLKSAPRP